RRNCPAYARRDPGKNKEELEDGEDVLDSLYSDHYGIISLGDYTVEVRAFRGTIAKPRLLACIELAYYSYEYCAKDDVYAKDLTWESFMQWLPEESKYIKP